MTVEVRVVLDSINPYNGKRLTTFQLKYWRGIHSEMMTHRVFSRNASSSRAIPIKTFLKQVWNDPAGPIHWGLNQPGMKARTELSGFKKWFASSMWRLSGKVVCGMVWLTNKVSNPHKQTFNRMLEPWQYIHVIITATEWDNFYALRDHPDAQPEIQELASLMHKAMNDSKPALRYSHIPYVSDEEVMNHSDELLYKLSTARNARVSYLTHDGSKPNIEKDITLHDQLVESLPPHMSPTEHIAFAVDNLDFHKNFQGWVQYRQEVEDRIYSGDISKKK